jgi:hypothetical protein
MKNDLAYRRMRLADAELDSCESEDLIFVTRRLSSDGQAAKTVRCHATIRGSEIERLKLRGFIAKFRDKLYGPQAAASRPDF